MSHNLIGQVHFWIELNNLKIQSFKPINFDIYNKCTVHIFIYVHELERQLIYLIKIQTI
jgi:hypothetical protein